MSQQPLTDHGRRTQAPRPGPLGRLGAAAVRHRGKVVLGWLAILAAAFGLSAAFSGEYTNDYSAPGSDSQRAHELLENRFPAQATESVDVVFRSEAGFEAPAVRSEVTALLAELGNTPHVESVDDPFATPESIAPDGQTLLAELRLDVVDEADMPIEDTERLRAGRAAPPRPGLDVALGGQAIEEAEEGEIGSETIALVAAAVILLITFGSVVAAGLPLVVAIFGLGVSATLIGVFAAVLDVPDWTTALVAMLGIALGIDYTLLMVTRFREWRASGLDPQTAVAATMDTAGRAVTVAGSTVVVSMLGLFAMGVSFMRGAAAATIVAVLVVMAAAVTLFPALLGYLGPRIDRLRLPVGRRRPVATTAGGHVEPARGWVWWSRLVGRHPLVVSALGVVALLAIAAPFLGARFTFPDAGNHVEETSTRQAYDLIAEGFGAGANGPLLVVADVSGTGTAGLEALAGSIEATPGVAAVLPPELNPDGDTALITVIPNTGPQHADTEEVVRTLRADVIPAAGVDAHVGGFAALSLDSNANTAERMPLLIGSVVLLSMVLLMLSFRSIAIPLTAAVMNLLSVAAAYGVIALVSEGGWLGQLVGIDNPTPTAAFILVLIFAVLFGLSTDYEVFLISRMRESWVRTRDNARSILDGLAGTGRVITAAAAIMIVVFAAFIPSDEIYIKVIGVGMAAAIFIDATIIRMLLVPAVMHLLGRSNWWLPSSWDRRLPQLHVEGPTTPVDHGVSRPVAGSVTGNLHDRPEDSGRPESAR
jgi:RND superfamily putative drug exporter